MQIRIGDRTITQWEKLTVTLKFDSVASTFAMESYFDPRSSADRVTFQPFYYLGVVITHNNTRVLSGTTLGVRFKSGPEKKLTVITGYSATGVLQDCPYIDIANGLSLTELANRAIQSYGIAVKVSPDVKDVADALFSTNDIDGTQSVFSIINSVASQRHIIVSHDEYGNVLLTRGNTDQAPIYNFDNTVNAFPATSMEFDCDGQRMHNIISVLRQRDIAFPNVNADTSLKNPFLEQRYTFGPLTNQTYKTWFRPTLIRQTAPLVNLPDLELTARNELAKELRSMALIIEMDGWLLNGKLVRPNQIITVKDPDLYLFNPTKFFIEEVQLVSDAQKQVAILKCVLPEVYNNKEVKNIFA
jgi:prophage tail gpP-like protein